MKSTDIFVSDEARAELAQHLKEGFIYQRFQHSCGYIGNSYHKVGGKWAKRTCCPQCNEQLQWIPMTRVLEQMMSQ